MNFRIGQGYDVHAFTALSGSGGSDTNYIVLGGERIAHSRELIAHSDGDVLLHAICDAMLGALALGDIGQQFPDTDPAFENIDSRQLLKQCARLVKDKGYRVANIDSTIIAQAPRMAGHIPAMRKNIASDLSVDDQLISVKATTTEKLGFCGREEGIACMAVVLLEPAQNVGS